MTLEQAGTEEPKGWSMPRGTIVLLSATGLIVTVGGMKAVSGLVGPIFLALMLTVAVQPIPVWLRRKGVPTWLAFIATLLAVYGILLTLFGSLAFSIARLATILPEYADKFQGLVDNFQEFLTSHGVSSDNVQDMISHIDPGKALGYMSEVLEGTLSVASALILVVTLLLFMSADALSYDKRINVLRGIRPDIAMAFQSFAQGTRSYLLVSTVFGLIVAVFDSVALWIVGIPLPILWGLLSFITNYIPNIGFVIGLIPPALLALLDGGWGQMLLVIAIYSVINVVIQSVIQPKFVGDAVGLSTTLTFLSLVFWAWVIGPLGAILAVPLTLMSKALLIDIDPSTRWADILLSSSAPKSEPDSTTGPPPDADGDAEADPGPDSTGEAGPSPQPG
ncbi:AI-2E family transporter [Gordonia sp. HNM0687]|uniref:AI-2E family transporter n=1 Tax=Gordonia mangrovi TaxID=2665643 RepID=A0A6L7GLN8_9ACTN|nr:AI-2E family transporter [Gordonia mangrovi]MXP20814.1 AI-2E family transporter [Gordonia mangrovi]UVF78621.1 AI-2E family transporter [Gordonia mangrovi]